MKVLTRIQTPFPEKFGVPRQSLLVDEAWGKMVFPKDDFFSEAFRGIDNFSHLWLIFQFSEVSEYHQSALVHPPRFEKKLKLGVFATRTPHRPNRLGLSVVKFDRLEILKSEIVLWVQGVDLVNETPIFDIKPYIPYCDSRPEAEAKLFFEAPTRTKVIWKCECVQLDMKSFIENVICLDPRPSQDKANSDSYGVSLAGYNVRFFFDGTKFLITEMTKE